MLTGACFLGLWNVAAMRWFFIYLYYILNILIIYFSLNHNLIIVIFISRGRADWSLFPGVKERDCNAVVLYLSLFTGDVLTIACLHRYLDSINNYIESLFNYILSLFNYVSSLFPGDVLTGACFLGLWNVAAMRWFVLAPLLLYLALGSVLLAAGFVSLFR